MSHLTRYTSLVLVLLMLTGCASTEQSDQSSSDRSVITQEELQERDYSNLYQAISSLRPGWMRARGQDSVRRPPPIQVYLGNTQLGGVDALRNFGVGEVAYVRYFDPNQAMAHFGVGHDQGVIYLSVSPDG